MSAKLLVAVALSWDSSHRRGRALQATADGIVSLSGQNALVHLQRHHKKFVREYRISTGMRGLFFSSG
jgi:hypothetical protein